MREEAKHTQTIIHCQSNDSLASHAFTFVTRLRAVTGHKSSAVKIDEHRKSLFARFGRGPDVQIQAILVERTRRRDPAWFDAFSAYTRSRAGVPHVKRTMRSLLELGTAHVPDAELCRISVPATLLWGRHDRMVPLTLTDAAGL